MNFPTGKMPAWSLKPNSSRCHRYSVRDRNSCVRYVCVARCSNVTTARNISSNIPTKLTEFINRPKLHSRCNKNAPTALLNLNFIGRDPPNPPYKLPSRAVPVLCLRHPGNAFGVPWPDHFSKAGDGPEHGLTVKSRLKGNDQEPIQSSSTSRPKHQTGQAQPRRHLKLQQWNSDGTIIPNRWPPDYLQ